MALPKSIKRLYTKDCASLVTEESSYNFKTGKGGLLQFGKTSPVNPNSPKKEPCKDMYHLIAIISI